MNRRYILVTGPISESRKRSVLARLRGLGVKAFVVNATPVKPGGRRPLLTPRQIAVLRAISSGLRTKEIAHDLSISVKTVETHRLQIVERLGIRTIPGLVRFALQNGVLSPSWLLDRLS